MNSGKIATSFNWRLTRARCVSWRKIQHKYEKGLFEINSIFILKSKQNEMWLSSNKKLNLTLQRFRRLLQNQHTRKQGDYFAVTPLFSVVLVLVENKANWLTQFAFISSANLTHVRLMTLPSKSYVHCQPADDSEHMTPLEEWLSS